MIFMTFLGKSAIFVGGMLFATAGVKILSGKTAKKVYAHTTAAAMRCKDTVMEGVTKVREGCDDIVSDAKDINEKLAAEEAEEEIIDASEIIEDNSDKKESDGE
ncbi:MAG: hypothetical protein J6M17_12470 [Ruminococcus sp.]|nr:hypothetical protein [Ruminococcus sp.]